MEDFKESMRIFVGLYAHEFRCAWRLEVSDLPCPGAGVAGVSEPPVVSAGN